MANQKTVDVSTFRTIGILGGMGPEATVRLFERIIALTPAKRDQEHLPILICNLPQIPDRTAAIQGRGESPVPAASKGLQILAAGGADFIAVPCNTIHHYFHELQAAVNIPILHLIAEVQCTAAQRWPNLRRLGLLATDGTLQSGVYQKFFAAAGCEIIFPEPFRQQEIMSCIYAIKAGEKRFREALAAGRDLLERRAQGIILGCTELSLVKNFLANDLPIIDSIEVLAQACVDIARGVREVPKQQIVIC
ncbi:MAG: amino acid racemase [candidate division KSB1 bacterium]|nr:amino acid racemase [candidate division KSB1 bacterium]MDZ7304055.1 amino acid racemase [candidate division KSB1 bacterium]MDZ7313234.1 amino acid racemase [candidate division KSB1 bacterium]